jgi:hypothetical protein
MQTYTVTGTDGFGNNWNATSEVTFTAQSGGTFGTPPGNNVFTGTTPLGTFVITATASNGTLVTTTVNVTVGAAVSITISPRDITVIAGQSVTYTSVITDAYGNTGDGTSVTMFTAAGGNVFVGNVLSATVAGTWAVTGTSASASDTTHITILPGPAARLGIGSITTQTAGVSFPLTITVYDTFNNVVTGFTDAISLTDSTGTLLPATWSSWSNGMATPVVTVTRATTSDRITVTVVTTPSLQVVSNLFAVAPNVPAVAALQVSPTAIQLGATANLTATLWDAYTNLVANGTVVTFTTTDGTFANGQAAYTSTTTYGVATARLTASCTAHGITLTAQSGAAFTQTSASFVAPGIPATITLALQSNSLPVGGVTTALTATVRDCAGNLVGNGVPVAFSIAPIAAAIVPSATTTTGGIAAATLTSPQTAGNSIVTAMTGAIHAQAAITFTPLAPYTITVTALPPIISPTTSSNIRATVVDRYNNAVAEGTSVAFAATLGTVAPTSAGTVNGLASSVFTAGSVEGTAVVTATAGSIYGTTTVIVTTGRSYIYLPLVMRNYSHGKNLVVASINISPANPSAASVVIQNAGDVPITETFDIDLYLDPPNPNNIQVNKMWYDIGCTYGVMWEISSGVQAGQFVTLTLASGDPYLLPSPYTKWPSAYSSGTHTVWALVDSYGPTQSGLVQETNESDNIRGPVTFNVP